MNVLIDPCPLATKNLATPDNCHNCEPENSGDAEQTKPADPAKLPLAFTVITSIRPTRLTKIIGLNAKGGMRKETAAMLGQGHA